MSGRYLLDTNIVIALFANDAAVVEQIRGAEEVFIPSVVIGELYYGARRSGRVEANIERVDEFATESIVLSCDVGSAQRYAEIKDELRNWTLSILIALLYLGFGRSVFLDVVVRT